MKGLMIKDWKLVTQRKTFFILLIVIAFFLRSQQGGLFAVTYMTMLTVIFGISTLNYDEYENSFPFLLTLPFSRRTYVREKYLFVCLVSLAGWLSGVAIFAVSLAEQGTLQTLTAHGELLACPSAALALLDIMLPIQLKFGAEKSRIVLFIVAGMVSALAAIVLAVLNRMGISDEAMSVFLSGAGELVVIGVICAILACVTLISYRVSVRVLESKEF